MEENKNETMEQPKFIVKEVTGIEQKSTQEIEKELLERHEEKFSDKKEETVIPAAEEKNRGFIT